MADEVVFRRNGLSRKTKVYLSYLNYRAEIARRSPDHTPMCYRDYYNLMMRAVGHPTI